MHDRDPSKSIAMMTMMTGIVNDYLDFSGYFSNEILIVDEFQ